MDVTTHLVDLVQWMTGNGTHFDFERDVDRLSARQWPTAVPRDVFSRITGLEDFPEILRDNVTGDALQFLCNAALSYRLRGIPVEIETLWGLEEPAGGGDLHQAILRGSKADLVVDKGAETEFLTTLTINPVEGGKAYAETLDSAVAGMQVEFPGIGIEPAGKGFRVVIPRALRTSHEQHFAAVLQTFLTYLDEGNPPGNLGSDLDAKYTLLARAHVAGAGAGIVPSPGPGCAIAVRDMRTSNFGSYHEYPRVAWSTVLGTKTRRKPGTEASVRISLHRWIPDHFNAAHCNCMSILELQSLLFVPSW